jgi:hypothetical protein
VVGTWENMARYTLVKCALGRSDLCLGASLTLHASVAFHFLQTRKGVLMYDAMSPAGLDSFGINMLYRSDAAKSSSDWASNWS